VEGLSAISGKVLANAQLTPHGSKGRNSCPEAQRPVAHPMP
jgi:hypothetical protein